MEETSHGGPLSTRGTGACSSPDYRSLDHRIIYQVLTQEDWNIVLFAGMERTSHWAALYFVALMTFGNYVLFNLLVAILVEGFSNQVYLYIRHIDNMVIDRTSGL